MDVISALVAALLPLIFLVGIYLIIARRLGLPRFRPGRALLIPRKPTGPLVGLWLALLAGSWTMMEAAAELGPAGTSQTIAASAVVTAIGVVILGLVVARRFTVFALSVLGILAQVINIAEDFGVSAMLLCLVSAALITWLYGLARGLLPGD